MTSSRDTAGPSGVLGTPSNERHDHVSQVGGRELVGVDGVGRGLGQLGGFHIRPEHR